MITLPHLMEQYRFSNETVQAIERAANLQDGSSELEGFYALKGFCGVERSTVRTVIDSKPVEYIDLQSGSDSNGEIRVLFDPMCRETISPVSIMRSLRLFDADDPAHLIVTGTPSYASLTKQERQLVAGGDLAPIVHPILSELERLKYTSIDVLGGSFGAGLAQSAAKEAQRYDISVRRAVLIDPIDTEHRQPSELVRIFKTIDTEIPKSLQQSKSRMLRGAIAEQSNQKIRHILPEINKAFTDNTFNQKRISLLHASSAPHITTAYGSASEISNPAAYAAMDVLDIESGLGGHSNFMRINKMSHAGLYDINLFAAIILEGLAKAAP